MSRGDIRATLMEGKGRGPLDDPRGFEEWCTGICRDRGKA